ncbi:MAG: hypothetical protein D6752_07055 [Candidatus Nitrosothermus koennekii]|nr:MAG: hypothetical protein D6752_07055 [Candidatus Nitrosothermus koennekii]
MEREEMKRLYGEIQHQVNLISKCGAAEEIREELNICFSPGCVTFCSKIINTTSFNPINNKYNTESKVVDYVEVDIVVIENEETEDGDERLNQVINNLNYDRDYDDAKSLFGYYIEKWLRDNGYNMGAQIKFV